MLYFALILKEKCYFIHSNFNHSIKILQTGVLYYICIILDSLFPLFTNKCQNTAFFFLWYYCLNMKAGMVSFLPTAIVPNT